MKKLLKNFQNFDIDSDQMDDFFDQLNDNDISLVNEKIVQILTRN